MTPVEKAIKLRKSLHLRSKAPQIAFQRRLEMPRAILKCVEEHELNSRLFNEARRHYVVCLCSAFELYWRDFIKQTVDANKIGNIDIRRLRNHKFSFSDLQLILGQRLTLGELIANSYTFQGTEVLNQVCQDIFSVDLFAGISKIQFTYVEPKTLKESTPSFLKGVEILKHRDDIDRCFSIRHETVHNTGTQFRVSQKTLRNLEGTMGLFNLFASIVLESKLKTQQE